MNPFYNDTLHNLADSGNLRTIPSEIRPEGIVDFSTNDYLGLATRTDLQQAFLNDTATSGEMMMTSSASRLLASAQKENAALENLLSRFYGRPALLFNSGYHANTGMVQALASDGQTLIVADKLVHASIIDGIRLSGARFERFRHNDFDHLERIVRKHADVANILVIAESVYSMDGVHTDIAALTDLKRRYPSVMLYIDEAHAVGVEGPAGLGMCMASGRADEVDVIVGTFGKALASNGAFCITSDMVRRFLINRARSFIFSTALPPICVRWSAMMLETSAGMDSERSQLQLLAKHLHKGLTHLSAHSSTEASHIQPFITGDAAAAVELSQHLLDHGMKVLPIRTPTVPPGTERLRISLSAALSMDCIDNLVNTLTRMQQCVAK